MGHHARGRPVAQIPGSRSLAASGSTPAASLQVDHQRAQQQDDPLDVPVVGGDHPGVGRCRSRGQRAPRTDRLGTRAQCCRQLLGAQRHLGHQAGQRRDVEPVPHQDVGPADDHPGVAHGPVGLHGGRLEVGELPPMAAERRRDPGALPEAGRHRAPLIEHRLGGATAGQRLLDLLDVRARQPVGQVAQHVGDLVGPLLGRGPHPV